MNPVLLALGLMMAAIAGAILSATLRAHYRRTYLRPTANWLLAMRVVSVVLMVLGSGGLILMGLGTLLFPLVISATAILVVSFAHLRKARRHQLLSLLAVAMHEQIPLGELVQEFAADTAGRIGRRAARLADSLNAGQPLTWGLRRFNLSRRWLLALLVTGEEAGALPEAFAEAAAISEPAAGDEETWQTATYFISTLLVMLCVLLFFLYKIFPEFVKIAEDFTSEPPAMLITLNRFAELPLTDVWLVFGVLGCLFLLCGDGVTGMLPRFGQLRRRTLRALLLRSMAIVVEARQPVEQALQSLARAVPSWWISWRLNRVVRAIERGEVWHVQLACKGLITRAESSVLAAAERANNLGWALRELAVRNERLAQHRWQMQMKLAVPVLTILLGACAGWFAFGSMTFLNDLIVKLT